MSLAQLRAVITWCAEQGIPDSHARLERGPDGKPVVYAHVPAGHLCAGRVEVVEGVRVVVSVSPPKAAAFASDYEEPAGA